MAEEDVDTNDDGEPDVWKFYVNGQLQRIRRDRNFDGKADIWEIVSARAPRARRPRRYVRRARRPVDRDEQMKYEAETADRKARDEMMNAEMAAKADAGGGSTPTGADAGAGAKDAGAPKAAAPARKK